MSQSLRLSIVLGFLFALPLSAANPPALLSISPQTVIAGTGSFTLTATGANFVSGAALRVNGSSRTTTFVSSTRLTATITAADIAASGSLQITATNPGTLPSSALTLTVLPNSPAISSLTPSTLLVGTSSLTVTVAGSNFASNAVVLVNNSARGTAYVDSSHLTVTLLASDVASPTTLLVVVQNPNNRLSDPVTLQVKVGTTAPTITLLSPNSVASGGPAFTLTVVGTNFVNGTAIKVNSVARATTFVDSSHLTTQITAPDIVNPSTISIVVVNPDGTASAPASLTVTAVAVPVINSISPTSVTAGSAPFTLTITGMNFVSGSTVQIGTVSRTTTFVDSTRLKVTIQTADVLTVGQVPITVTTPQPKSATSNQAVLYVVATNAPSITSISPQSVQAGSSAFGLSVNGTNFLIDDVVKVGGNARTTQYISASQLVTTIAATDIASPATLDITVARHDGSAVSSPVTLTVTDAAAVSIASFNPPSANVGDPPFTLAVIGHNFTTTSVVTFDNNARTTQYVSATELRINLIAADLIAARGVPVQVVNGDGSSSAAVLFYVVNAVPAITSLTPSSVISGDSGFKLVVAGSGFSASSVISINGTPLTTAYQSDAGTLTADIDAALISAPGTLNVTVTRDGITSTAAALPVRRPTITGVTPSSIMIGEPTITLTVQGSAFLATSTVVFAGAELTTTLDPHGFLVATIDGTTLTGAGAYAVSVRNSPNSISAPFIIQVEASGTPEIDSVSPANMESGSAATSIQLNGRNFVALSVVQVNGSPRPTVYVGANILHALLLEPDLAFPGTLHITVKNPDGVTSAERVVTITGPTQPPSRRRAARH